VKIGLFGGTFDPPHSGHLIVAQDALLALGLDRVLFVPAARPPHKQGASISPAPLRARMLELAIEGDDRFSLDRLELERSGPSYTVDTLRELAGREPAARWTLLLGADQYAEFETWHQPSAIRRLASLAVLMRGGTHGSSPSETPITKPVVRPARAPVIRAEARDGADERALPGVIDLGHGDVGVAVTRIDISATAIRARAAAGLSIRYLVPERVGAFIFEHRLYGRNGTSVAG
jgi:nicotinate-nucleotide adenylyltransferase